jgi:hypothetical protein
VFSLVSLEYIFLKQPEYTQKKKAKYKLPLHWREPSALSSTFYKINTTKTLKLLIFVTLLRTCIVVWQRKQCASNGKGDCYCSYETRFEYFSRHHIHIEWGNLCPFQFFHATVAQLPHAAEDSFVPPLFNFQSITVILQFDAVHFEPITILQCITK